MTTSKITCKQRDYLVSVLGTIVCIPSPDASTPAPAPTPSTATTTVTNPRRPNDRFETDPENEVIFDPENEVIFDPENEVIFDPEQLLAPTDSQVVLNGFQNLYDCFGNKINLLNSKEQLIKLLYWLFKYEELRSYIENRCPDVPNS